MVELHRRTLRFVQPWRALILVLIATLTMAALYALWELRLEDVVMPHLIDTHGAEPFERQLQMIITAITFAVLAACGPSFLLLRAIVQQRRTANLLRISESRLREAQQRGLLGHWELALGADSVAYSEQVLRNLGIDEGMFELSLDIFYERIHPEDRERVRGIIDRAQREHRPGEYEYRTVLASGEVRIIHTMFEIERDEKDRPICIRGVDQDVTTYKKTQSDLEAALTQVRRLSQAQQEFVARAAHELRTPLAVLKAQIERRRFDADTLTNLEHDLDQSIRIVNQLVDAARYDALPRGEPARVDMNAIAAEVIRGLGPLAVKDGKTISLTADGDPLIVKGYHDALVVAVRNLVENALSYTPSGTGVEVHISADGTISVVDCGPGVPADERAHVFGRFWRGQHSRGKVGSGLGLAMVSEIVEAHGGSVGVDENVGGGAVFTVTLHPDGAVGHTDRPDARDVASAN